MTRWPDAGYRSSEGSAMRKALEWLYGVGGPIIRWRLAQDFGFPVSGANDNALLTAVLSSPEVQAWLGNLGSERVHGSKATDAENAMAKLIEYGLRKGVPEFDQRMLPYAERIGSYKPAYESNIVTPFLVAAGYQDHQKVSARFAALLDGMHRTALRRSYDFYLADRDRIDVPSAWRDKTVYKLEHSSQEPMTSESLAPFPVPSFYDLIALSYWTPRSVTQKQMIQSVVEFVCDRRFQESPGGYLWSKTQRRCWAAGRCCLAVLTPERRLLALELFARFPVARQQPWFAVELAALEVFRTASGTYCFPADYLKETRDGYYVYNGNHMGLGQDRRNRNWREIESTFRMHNLKRLAGLS
jgi:hypothetical protein